MAIRRTPFAPNEWYHCYSRGVDKRIVFKTKYDYERFMQTLYLCNNTEPVRRDDLEKKSNEYIFSVPRGEPLVSIAAFCLMPNHFHLLLQERRPGGITAFMQKVGTAYTMYFNIKNERIGGLFVKPFRSKHIDGEQYLTHVAQYIHLNAAELFEPEWKKGRVNNMPLLKKKLLSYPYSSYADYYGSKRNESTIVDMQLFKSMHDSFPAMPDVIEEAHSYYQKTPL